MDKLDHSQNTDEVIESKKAGKKFMLCIIGFFVTFATVDAFFVYQAISTHRGVVVENAYEVGLNYNDIIEEARNKKAEDEEHTHE